MCREISSTAAGEGRFLPIHASEPQRRGRAGFLCVKSRRTSIRGGPIHNLRRESVHGSPRRLAARRDACVDHNPRFCRSSGAGWSNKSIEESAKTYHNSSYALPTILSKSIVPSRYLFCWLTSTVDSAWTLRARRTNARRLLDVLSRLFRVRSTPLMVLRRAAPPHDIIPAEKDVARVAVGR